MTILYLSGMREHIKLLGVMYFFFFLRLIDVDRLVHELSISQSVIQSERLHDITFNEESFPMLLSGSFPGKLKGCE